MHKYKHLLSLIFVIFFNAQPIMAAGELPSQWLDINSDEAKSQPSIQELDEAGRAVERIARVHGSTFEKLADNPSKDPDEWSVAALALDLSIAASGAMGVMLAGGEASTSLYWRPRANNNTKAQSDLDGTITALDATLSQADLENAIEPMLKAAEASGKIVNTDAMRTNVSALISEYHELVQVMYIAPDQGWQVSRFRLDISIDASGTVGPGTSLGGGVRLRFEWVPVSAQKALVYSERQRNFKKFIDELLTGMRAVDAKQFVPIGHELASVRIGLGIFAKFSFAVAKFSAKVMGHLYFTPVSAPAKTSMIASEIPAGATIPILSDNANGKAEVGEITTQAFVKGLKKTLGITEFLVRATDRFEGERWDLYQLKAGFALSLAATFGLVTIGGEGAIELTIRKT